MLFSITCSTSHIMHLYNCCPVTEWPNASAACPRPMQSSKPRGPSLHSKSSYSLLYVPWSHCICITLQGIYRLHVNGAPVGDSYFTPGWTDYARRLFYNAWDVTALIRPARTNALGAVVADGWYAGAPPTSCWLRRSSLSPYSASNTIHVFLCTARRCCFRTQALLCSHTRSASSTEAVAAAHANGECRAPRPQMLCTLICRLRRDGGAGAVRTAQGAPAAAGRRDVRRELDHGVRHRRRLAMDR